MRSLEFKDSALAAGELGALVGPAFGEARKDFIDAADRPVPCNLVDHWTDAIHSLRIVFAADEGVRRARW